MTSRNLPVPMPGTDIVPDGWWQAVLMPWVDEQMNGNDLREAGAKLDYLASRYRMMGTDAVEFVKSRRYLEVRIGELLGINVKRGPQEFSHACEISGLSKDEVYRFRQLAAHKRAVVILLEKATREEEITRAAILSRVVPRSAGGAATPDPEGDILTFAELCNRVVLRADAAIFAFWANPSVPIPDVVMDSMRSAVSAIRHVMKEMESHA